MAATSEFTNVARLGWHRRGFFSGQTAYVTLAFIIICGLAAAFSGNFTTTGNLLNISRNFSYIALMSLGMTVVIITGGIDLSVGSVCALVAVCSMIVMRSVTNSPLVGVPYATVTVTIIAGLLLAGMIGLINGFLIAVLELSPFVTTLGMLSICRGLTYVITQGRGQAPSGEDVQTFFAVTNGSFGGVPVQVVYVLAAAAALGLALHHSVWGRHLFA